MVAYMLSKNGWVMPFFVIFRLAREKLLVTVALDHPVLIEVQTVEGSGAEALVYRLEPMSCWE